jgi:hypothetical protein
MRKVTLSLAALPSLSFLSCSAANATKGLHCPHLRSAIAARLPLHQVRGCHRCLRPPCAASLASPAPHVRCRQAHLHPPTSSPSHRPPPHRTPSTPAPAPSISSCQPPHRPPPCRSLLTPASTLTPPLHRLPPHAGSSRWSPHRPPLCHPPRQPPLCDVLGTFSISAGGQRPWCGSGCGKKRECVDMRDEGRGLV